MKRPYILISSAVSADGKIARAERLQLRLSNDADKAEIDRIRSEMDAVLVGSTTVRNDNPALVIKSEELRRRRVEAGKPADPIKVAISKNCDIPLDSDFMQLGRSEKIIFTTSGAEEQAVERLSAIATVVTAETARVDLQNLVSTLFDRGIRKMMVEGGGETNSAFLRAGLVDELRVAIAPTIIGGRQAPTLVDGDDLAQSLDLELVDSRVIGEMIIINYRTRNS